MKKIVSALVIALMLLSCMSLSAFAADSLKLTYTASEVDADGYFMLDLKADADLKSGAVVVEYNGDLVEPANYTDAPSAYTIIYAQDTVNKMVRVDFALNNADPNYVLGQTVVVANQTIVKIKFKKIADITAGATVVGLPSNVDEGWGYDLYSGAQCVGPANENYDNAEECNMSFEFNTAALEATGEEGDDDGEDDPVYTWGTATDVVADEKGVTGTKVAVFGKVSGGDGKKLEDNEYWVTFGQNTYYGKASESAVKAWAIVIYDPNGTKVEADRTYGYTAGMTDVPSWTGSVTARAVAAE